MTARVQLELVPSRREARNAEELGDEAMEKGGVVKSENLGCRLRLVGKQSVDMVG